MSLECKSKREGEPKRQEMQTDTKLVSKAAHVTWRNKAVQVFRPQNGQTACGFRTKSSPTFVKHNLKIIVKHWLTIFVNTTLWKMLKKKKPMDLILETCPLAKSTLIYTIFNIKLIEFSKINVGKIFFP